MQSRCYWYYSRKAHRGRICFNGVALPRYNQLLTVKKKYLRWKEREEAGKTLLQTSATEYRRHKSNEIKDSTEKHEPPTLYTENVLRNAKQEYKDLQHDDVHGNYPVFCLELMKHSQPHRGSIHDIGLDKFFIHYYSPLQVHVYKILCKSQYISLVIDATGSLEKRY